MFDVLALYVEQGYVHKQLVLREWGHTYAGTSRRATVFVAARLEAETGEWSAWPNFQKFGGEADLWARAQCQDFTAYLEGVEGPTQDALPNTER
jgi:hypothetical protein